MIALEDLVDLLCLVAQAPPEGLRTWIACGSQDYSVQAIHDLLRHALGKGVGIGWLPRWAWLVAARVLDVLSGQPHGSIYFRLFGTEIYSNAAVLAQTRWRPRVGLEDVIADIAGAGGSGS